MSSEGKRIVFTGGSGKAGRHVIPELVKRGHKVIRCFFPTAATNVDA